MPFGAVKRIFTVFKSLSSANTSAFDSDMLNLMLIFVHLSEISFLSRIKENCVHSLTYVSIGLVQRSVREMTRPFPDIFI